MTRREIVVLWQDAGELGPYFYPADGPGVYPPIPAEEIAARLNEAEAEVGRLRAAALSAWGALMGLAEDLDDARESAAAAEQSIRAAIEREP